MTVAAEVGVVYVPDAPESPLPFVQLDHRYCLPVPAETGVEAVMECVEVCVQVNVCGSCE